MSDVVEDAPEVEVDEPAPAKETDWKSEARKWEQRAKENSLAAARLAELEESQKSEAQKLEERASSAETKLTQTELRALRAEVALEKGLTPSQAKRLVGSSLDELAADADELLRDLGKQSTGPRPDPSQGPKVEGGKRSPADEFAAIITKQRTGQ